MSDAGTQPVATEIPMKFRRRGGKAVIVLPDGTRGIQRAEATVDNTMIKALARAWRWQQLLLDGTYATIEQLAEAEKIIASYVSRVTRLACLAPAIVEAILDGKHPPQLTMRVLLEPPPLEWEAQQVNFARASDLRTAAT
jgi:hypothetical protein